MKTTRGYACIGLDNPKTNSNIGAALRAVGVFGANMIDVIYIPTARCLNLAACVNVVLYDRLTKLS